MKSNFARGPGLGFLLRFVVIFGVLIVPWPGWNHVYSHYFQSLGQIAFNRPGAMPRMVVFAPATDNAAWIDTTMTLENAALADSSGNGPAKMAKIDSRSIGWVPTALTIALVLATPISWRRRLLALAGGVLLIHLFIFLTLLSWIWDNSTGLSLLTLSSIWQRVAGELDYALMNQLGVSFSVPVVIWILVTFRRQDQDALAT